MGRIVALSAAGVMLLAACGDDDAGSDDDAGDGDGRGQEYVEAMSASLQEEGEFQLDGEQADCVAAALVDVVGVDTLSDAGISPEEFGDADNLESLDLPDDAVDRLGNAAVECDLVGFFEDVLIDSFSRELGTELSSEAAACLRDNLDDRALADAVARTFIDGSDEHMQEPAVSALAACPPVMTEALLAQASSDLPPAAEACLADFVEDNADLMAQQAGGSREARQEAGARLTAACPDVAAALSG